MGGLIINLTNLGMQEFKTTKILSYKENQETK